MSGLARRRQIPGPRCGICGKREVLDDFWPTHQMVLAIHAERPGGGYDPRQMTYNETPITEREWAQAAAAWNVLNHLSHKHARRSLREFVRPVS